MPMNSRRLLVIIPALNEEATIGSVIAGIPREILGISSVDVLVVDDGSTDDTTVLAAAAGADVVSHPYNQGVGAAMQTGLREAMRRGVDAVVNIDGDGQFDPGDIPELLRPVIEGKAVFATASRFKDPDLVPEMPAIKRLGNHWMARLISGLTGLDMSDVSCGFRAFSREAILWLNLFGRFTYTQEMILLLAFHGLGIVEVPLRVRGVRQHGTSRVASSLLVYAFQTSAIIFGCIRDYRPGWIFNTVSLVLAVTGAGFAAFFILHWFVYGSFSPHIWSGFTAAFLLGFSFLLFFFGQVALMLRRIRLLQEEQTYYLRKRYGVDGNANDPG